NLKVLLGVPMETEIVLDAVSFNDIEKEAHNYNAPQDFSLQNRTEIKVVDAQIRLADLQAKSIRAENYPRLSAFFNYSYNGVSNQFNDYLKTGGSDIWYGVGAVGLRLNIPLFD